MKVPAVRVQIGDIVQLSKKLPNLQEEVIGIRQSLGSQNSVCLLLKNSENTVERVLPKKKEIEVLAGNLI